MKECKICFYRTEYHCLSEARAKAHGLIILFKRAGKISVIPEPSNCKFFEYRSQDDPGPKMPDDAQLKIF